MTVWHNFIKQFRPGAGRRGRRASLRLERLEERCTPATFFVSNSGNDGNNGQSAGQAVADIQQAINLAKNLALQGQDNNTILVAAGTYTFNSSLATDSRNLGSPAVVGVVDQQLTIIGGFNSFFNAYSGSPSVIDGGGSVRGVVVIGNVRPTSVTLDNFTVQNCFGGPSTIQNTLSAFGGGMVIAAGGVSSGLTIVVRNTTFTKDTAQGSANTNGSNSNQGGDAGGGGLAALGSNSVVLQNVTFDTNTAQGGNGPTRGGSGLGGGLYAGNGAQISGENLTFTNNDAIGGTSTSGGTVNSEFAEGFGGGFALQNAGTSVNFSNVIATGNLAQGGNSGSGSGDNAGFGRGGAFYSEEATVSLTDATVSGNKAAGGAGGKGNVSSGGGIFTFIDQGSGVLTLNRVSLLNNTVTGGTAPNPGVLGGGLGMQAAGVPFTANILNSVIAGNMVTASGSVSANSGGGGVWFDGVMANVSQSTIADNTVATNMSGRAFLLYSGTLNLADDIVANHTGGAAIVTVGGTVNLAGKVLFANNTSDGVPAGANHLTAADAKFVDSTNRNYNLQSGSPAVNAATDSTQFIDITINRRVGVPDLGAFEFGTGGITPRPAGSFDKLGAFRQSDGSWSLDTNGNRVFDSSDRVILNFGGVGRTGVAGSWLNNGFSQIGDFSGGQWRLDLNDNGTFDSSDRTFAFGDAGDIPIVGNFYGTGTRIGIFRTAPDGVTGEFIIDTNNDGRMDTGDETFTFGAAGDRIVVGDWNGDGKSKVGVFRSTHDAANTAVFTLDTNNNHQFDSGADAVFTFGVFTDGIVIGDWNGDGTSKVGVYRPATSFGAPGTAVFSLDNNNNHVFDSTDQVFLFGVVTDQFLAGNWAPMELAASAGPGPGVVLNSVVQVDPIMQDAITRWAGTGITPAQVGQLRQVQVNVEDLPGAELGLAEGNAIVLNANAAGHGWFTDSSPAGDAAFADPNGPAAGQIDLLTVVEHELGHVLGLPDDATGGLMDGYLPTGVRRAP
jgi:hypothetical protein